jgi:TPR repeat protein
MQTDSGFFKNLDESFLLSSNVCIVFPFTLDQKLDSISARLKKVALPPSIGIASPNVDPSLELLDIISKMQEEHNSVIARDAKIQLLTELLTLANARLEDLKRSTLIEDVENSKPSLCHKTCSSSQRRPAGKLFLDKGSAITVTDGQSAFIGDSFVKFSLRTDGSLQVLYGFTSNELSQYKIEVSDVVRRLRLTRLDLADISREILELTPSVENMVPGALEELGRLHGINGCHKKSINELEALFEVEFEVKETSSSIVLVDGKMTRVPFHNGLVVWCATCESEDLAVEVIRSSRVYSRRRLLGDGFYLGEGVTIDEKEGLRRWQLAAAAGDAMGKANVLISSDHDSSDLMEAFDMYHAMASAGDAVAQTWVGFCYSNGIGVAADAKKAVNWYRLAADQGLAHAQCTLGHFYLDGTGVAADPTEGVRWMRLAAEQGHTDAESSLGFCCKIGKGVIADLSEAVRWFRLAAKQGYVDAQFALGLCYENGAGVVAEPTEAARWYRLAADQGDSGAQLSLGVCYKAGKGVALDHEEAVRWFRRAADQGVAEVTIYALLFPFAQCCLNTYYEPLTLIYLISKISSLPSCHH